MARKYNVTSTIKLTRTLYAKYIEEADTIGEAISYEMPDIEDGLSREETLKILRKYDCDAVKLISQSGNPKQYGMTEEKFASISYLVDKKKRHNLVTRDKKNTYASYQYFDVKNQSMDIVKDYLIPDDVMKRTKGDKDKILQYIRKTVETETYRVLLLDDVYEADDNDMVYAVDKLTFIANAIELDGKGKPLNPEE